MFGFVTRRELDQAIDELERKQKRELEVVAFEWSRWYDKFRALYAQWVKRDKKALEDPPSEENGDEPSPQHQVIPGPIFFRRRRPF